MDCHPCTNRNAIAPELAKKGQVVFKLPAGEAGVAAEAASACEKVASDWLRTAELDTEEEEKKEPEEVADAAIPPEPRTKTELSSEGAVRAI